MDEDAFWAVIEAARSEAGDDCKAHVQAVTRLLMQRPLDDVLAYDRVYRRLMKDAYRYDLWGAAFIMRGGICSDDSFEYFRGWLILQGREVYTNALRDPDSLAAVIRENENERHFDCEQIGYVVFYVFEERANVDDLPDDFDSSVGFGPPQGIFYEGDGFVARYPALWALRGW